MGGKAKENTMNTQQALVIDGRTRKLNVFVASVTQAQSDNPYQLVLRHALDMGHIQDILAPTERDEYLGALNYETPFFVTNYDNIQTAPY